MERLENITDFFTVVISREEIENLDFTHALDSLNQLFVDEKTVMLFQERVEIGVFGYDFDSRELWDIPEVKSYFRKLDGHFPHWFYFLSKLGRGLKLVTFCCCETIKVTNTQIRVEPKSLEIFYEKHFKAMNNLVLAIGMSHKECMDLTDNVIEYFSK